MDEWLAQKPRVGNYEPFLRLAAGGMGAVYLARQVGAAGFERLVVVKRVHPHLLGESTFLDMLRDEARISSLIRHPHVVPVIDVVDVNRELFLILEYVESIALSTLIRARRVEGNPLPIPVVGRILVDVLAGLHAAHEACDLTGTPLSVVHRDVSPHNVLVGSDGSARLIDFGIAKAESRLTVTKSGSLKGKIRYMSPEQIRQRPVDRRSDVYSAGVVLYEAVTGKHLFSGSDEGAILLQVLTGEVPDPSEMAEGIPPALDTIVSRATNTDPEQRYQTAADLQEALESALPLAPTREVRALVDHHAHDTFEARRTAIETWFQAPRATAAPAITTTPAPATPAPATPAPQQAADAGPPPRARSVVVPIVGVTLAAGLGLAAIYAWPRAPVPTSHAEPSATTTASASPAVMSTPPGVASASLQPEPTLAPTKSAASNLGGKLGGKPSGKPVKPGSTTAAPDLHKNPYEAN